MSFFWFFIKIFFLNIKKPLIGSEVLLPKNDFTIRINILDAKSLKIFRLCFLSFSSTNDKVWTNLMKNV